MYTQIPVCRLCSSPRLVDSIDLGSLALTGIFPKTAREEVPAGPLALVKCGQCGLVQLKHNYESSMLYGATYGYRSGLNASMVAHLQGKVREIERTVALKPGDLVVDIGSNDGTLLNSYAEPSLSRIGIDPSGLKFQQYYKPGVELIPDFFSARTLRRATDAQAKVVTSIAMFYDLEDPLDFVRQIRDILAEDGMWVFEQSYLPSMVETNSYDTICHEHLEYYALEQIIYIADRMDLKVTALETSDINGGSFSIGLAHKSAQYPEATAAVNAMLAREREAGYGGMGPLQRLNSAIEHQREQLLSFLKGAKREGKTVFGYGASTKGNVLLQYCGITADLLPCIAEVNSDKFGSYTPGTRIPIISEAEARARKPDYFLVLPWHFRNAIVLKESDYLSGGGCLVFPLPALEVVAAQAAVVTK
jgi:hypothetical protein